MGYLRVLNERHANLMTGHFKMRPQIVIADDNARFLSSLVAALSGEFEVIATATDGRSALNHIKNLEPALAVLDLNMPELSGIEIAREVTGRCLSCKTVICSVESDAELIAAALAAGALGYVLKPRLHKDLLVAVKSAVRGETFVSGSDDVQNRAAAFTAD